MDGDEGKENHFCLEVLYIDKKEIWVNDSYYGVENQNVVNHVENVGLVLAFLFHHLKFYEKQLNYCYDFEKFALC